MRTIKFRGKDIKTGEWLHGNIQVPSKEGVGYFMWDCDHNQKEVIPDTVGQFTGLTDKNGKEIYEGDILRGDEYPFNCDGIDNYFAEVVWADNVCGFYRITHKKANSTVRGISHGNWSELDEEDIKSFEIIGNIHDNPELLKGGNYE